MNAIDDQARALTDRIQILPALQLLLVVLSGLQLLLAAVSYVVGDQSFPLVLALLFLTTAIVVAAITVLAQRKQRIPAAHFGSIYLLIITNIYLIAGEPPAPGLAFLVLAAVGVTAIAHSIPVSVIYAVTGVIVELIVLRYLDQPIAVFFGMTLAGLLFIWLVIYQGNQWQQRAVERADALKMTISSLDDHIKRQMTILQQREDDVEVIIETGQKLSILDADEVYRRALLTVHEHIPFSRSFIAVLKPATNMLIIRIDMDSRLHNVEERIRRGGDDLDLAVWTSTAQMLNSGQPLQRNIDTPDIELGVRDFLRADDLHYLLELPLMREPMALGTLTLFRDVAFGDFDSHELRLARAFSFQITTAISNAASATETRTRVAQLNTFSRLSEVLSQTRDLHELFADARREIMPLFEVTGISILLVRRDNRTMTWAYGYEHGQEVDLSQVGALSIDTGFSGHVARTGKPLLVNQSAREQQAAFRSFSVGASASAWLGVPLIAANKTIGVLAIENADQPMALTEKDTRLLTTIAGSLAISINNQLQLEQIQQALAAQSSQSMMLRTAADVSAVASRLLDLDELSRQVVTLVQTRFSLFYVGLYLLAEDGQTARLEAARRDDETGALTENSLIPINDNTLVGRAIATGRIHFVQANREREFRGLAPGLPGSGSELVLPLRSRQGILGALDVHGRVKNAFSDETISVLQTLADRLGGAIENARLFATVQASYIRLNNLFQASRQITGAADQNAVFQTLVGFARAASPIDTSFVVAPDAAADGQLTIPQFWSRSDPFFARDQRFERAAFPLGEPTFAAKNSLLNLVDPEETLPQSLRDFCGDNGISALALFPFFRSGQWLATWVLARQNRPLSEDRWQPFSTLAGQAHTVLANQALLEETVILYAASRNLNQAITREDALNIVTAAVQSRSRGSACRIVLYDERRGIGRIVSQAPEISGATELIWPMGADPVYRELRGRGRATHLIDDGSDSETIRRYLKPFKTRISLIAPAFSQNELIGFMAVDARPDDGEFGQEDVDFIQTLVDQLTIQIENLALFDEALTRAQEMITLNQIGTLVTGTLDKGELAAMVYEQTMRLVRSDIFVMAMADLEARSYETLIFAADGQVKTMTPRRLTRQDPIFRFLAQQLPRLGNDDPSLYHATVAELDLDNTAAVPRSAIWLPIIQEEKSIGLIAVQSWAPFAFDENHLQVIRTISNQTSLGLANIRLFGEIQTANEQLRELDRLKTQFLTNMSHELRTPLNAIIGFSRIMLKGITGPVTEEQEQDLTAIYNSGRHLLNLINDILDVARIEAGKMILSVEEVSLPELAEQVLDTARGLVNEKPIEIIATIEPDLPVMEADPIRLRQILLNLLSNAAKFTEKGYIRLEVRRQGDDRIYFAVQDTGVGIHSDDFHKIFEAFEQTEQSADLGAEGTGLGLPITKSLTEIHDGEIWVESEVGQGTTFHISLPIRQNGAGTI